MISIYNLKEHLLILPLYKLTEETIQIPSFITSKQQSKFQLAKSLPILTVKHVLSLTNDHYGD